MKITIKTLKGTKFIIESNESDNIGKVKQLIELSQGNSFPAANQKLIHSGKVLQDDATVTSCGITEASFLVCMVTKPKTQASSASTSSSAVSTSAPALQSSSSSSSSSPAPAVSTTDTLNAPSTTTAPTSTTTPAIATPATATNISAQPSINSDAVRQLCDMGFPEDQVHAALRAAFNNADRAVEYLMNGIPENLPLPAPSTASTPATSDQSATVPGGIEAIRRHPQFDSLRQIVQSNPSALPAVLQQIGGQNPDLLRLIHENQEEFVRILNEPVTSTSANPPTTASPQTAPSPASTGAFPSPSSIGSLPLGQRGMSDPRQLSQMLGSLGPQEQAQLAQSMGMTPDMLQRVSQMMANMPPEQMQQLMSMMGSGRGGTNGAPGSAGGIGGMPTGAGGAQPGVTIQLNTEEAAAVNRLCDMGFNRNDVIQAYLACEKNEALAANFLMDSMTSGDFEGQGGNTDSGGSGENNGGNDDIYG